MGKGRGFKVRTRIPGKEPDDERMYGAVAMGKGETETGRAETA